MTRKFLKGIRFGKYWMPKATEVTRQAVCAYPPTKEILAGIVYDLLLGFKSSGNPEIDASVRRTAIQVKRKPPCKRWMLQIIAQCEPEHLIFSKNFTKEMARPKKKPEEEFLVNNADGFFDGLEGHPDFTGTKRKRKNNFWSEEIAPHKAKVKRM